MTRNERMRINLMIAQIVDRIEDYELAHQQPQGITLDELYDAKANITLRILAQHGFRAATNTSNRRS